MERGARARARERVCKFEEVRKERKNSLFTFSFFRFFTRARFTPSLSNHAPPRGVPRRLQPQR